MDSIKTKKDYIVKLQRENDEHAERINDNAAAIKQLQSEVDKFEKNKWAVALDTIINVSPCIGITCGNCHYEGGCDFNTIVHEARRIRTEFEKFGYSLRK